MRFQRCVAVPSNRGFLGMAFSDDCENIPHLEKVGRGVLRRVADKKGTGRLTHDMTSVNFAVFHDDLIGPAARGVEKQQSEEEEELREGPNGMTRRQTIPAQART